MAACLIYSSLENCSALEAMLQEVAMCSVVWRLRAIWYRLRLLPSPLSSCGLSAKHGLMTEHRSPIHAILRRLQVALKLAA